MTQRLLDLFCGAGGASFGYHLAGFEVVGVDRSPQPNYPKGIEFHQGDALDFDPSGFDVIHASPPCQAFSAYRNRSRWEGSVGAGYPDLISAVRDRLEASGALWVIENVPGAPLRSPIQLCGSSFGLDVRRHRLFECSQELAAPLCNHTWQKPRFPGASNRGLRSTVEVGVGRVPLTVQKAAMGIDWMNRRELSEALPPAYTRFLGTQLLRC